MTSWLLYALVGFLSGILGGMGMGGGTILIPSLCLIFSLFQREAQGINLITFLPMAIVAVIMHSKNKLIDWKRAIIMAIPASVTSVLSSYLSSKAPESVLSTSFGIFLSVLGVFQIIDLLFLKKGEKGEEDKNKESKGRREGNRAKRGKSG